jgi:uncharacterized membrane protein
MQNSVSISLFQQSIRVKTLYVLLGIIGMAAFIRFHNLTYSSLWLDEIYSMIGSDPATSLLDVYTYSFNDQPPLFFILLHGWLKVFGYTDFAGRSITCIYGVLGVLAIFFLGKEVKDEKLGLLAAFITSINWFHVDISKEMRFYPLVFLLVMLSYLFLLRSLKRSAAWDFVGYAVFTSLLLNTHYYGMVVFVSQFVIFLVIVIFYKRSARLIIGGLVAGCAAGFSMYHWLPVIQHDLQINQFHVSPVKWDIVFGFCWNYVKEPVAFAVYAICTFLSVRIFYYRIKEKSITITHVVVGCWILLGFGIPLVYSLIKLPLLTHKYDTIIVPAIFLILANGFLYFPSTKIRAYTLLTITLSAFVILFYARPPYKPRRGEDWREVAAYFKDHTEQPQLIFSQLAWFHQYYFKKYKLAVPLDQNTSDFNKLVEGKKGIWLLQNSRYTGGWPTTGLLSAQQELVNREFEVTDSVVFKQTTAILYKRK